MTPIDIFLKECVSISCQKAFLPHHTLSVPFWTRVEQRTVGVFHWQSWCTVARNCYFQSSQNQKYQGFQLKFFSFEKVWIYQLAMLFPLRSHHSLVNSIIDPSDNVSEQSSVNCLSKGISSVNRLLAIQSWNDTFLTCNNASCRDRVKQILFTKLQKLSNTNKSGWIRDINGLHVVSCVLPESNISNVKESCQKFEDTTDFLLVYHQHSHGRTDFREVSSIISTFSSQCFSLKSESDFCSVISIILPVLGSNNLQLFPTPIPVSPLWKVPQVSNRKCDSFFHSLIEWRF